MLSEESLLHPKTIINRSSSSSFSPLHCRGFFLIFRPQAEALSAVEGAPEEFIKTGHCESAEGRLKSKISLN